jgi:DNA-binding NtrC family response regulator
MFRVVVENVDGAERFIEQAILEDAGFEVVGCAGPAELQDSTCPVTAGSDCPAIEAADLVVSSFRVEDPDGSRIIGAIRQRYPDTPIVVEAPPAAVQRHGEVLEGCHVLYPLTAQTLLGAASQILGTAQTA